MASVERRCESPQQLQDYIGWYEADGFVLWWRTGYKKARLQHPDGRVVFLCLDRTPMAPKKKLVIASAAVGSVVLVAFLIHLAVDAYWEGRFEDASVVVPDEPSSARALQLRLAPSPPPGTTVEWSLSNGVDLDKSSWDLGRLPEGIYAYTVNLTHGDYGFRNLTGSFEVAYEPLLVVEPNPATFGDRVTVTLDTWGTDLPVTVESFVVDGEEVNGQEFSRVYPLSRSFEASATVVKHGTPAFELQEDVVVYGKATIRPSLPKVVAGDRVTFSVNVEGMPSGYRVHWKTGSGNTDSGPTTTWQYTDAGEYSLHVIVTGEGGAIAEDEVEFKVASKPPKKDKYDLQRMEMGTYLDNMDADAEDEIVVWISLWDVNGKNVAMGGTVSVSTAGSTQCGTGYGGDGPCETKVSSKKFKKRTIGEGTSFERERVVYAAVLDTEGWGCGLTSDRYNVQVTAAFTTPDGVTVEGRDSVVWDCRR